MKGLKRIFAITVVLVIILSVLTLTTHAAEIYGTVTASSLNLRASASTGAAVLTQIPNGQKVQIFENTNGWAKVTYNGVTGYVSNQYINLGQVNVKLSGGTLNLRASASTSAAVLAQIPNGQALTVSEIANNWAKVTYNGTAGYVSCDYLASAQAAAAPASAPAPAKVQAQPAPLPSRNDSVSSKGQAVVELAKQHLGKAYVYGATGPNNFDCSGLVYYVYKAMGVTLNRVANDQMTNGTWVSRDNLQPGDIVGFSNGGGYVNHVGIYAGNGMMIHSPQTGDVVKYENITTGNYARRLVCGRRIF